MNSSPLRSFLVVVVLGIGLVLLVSAGSRTLAQDIPFVSSSATESTGQSPDVEVTVLETATPSSDDSVTDITVETGLLTDNLGQIESRESDPPATSEIREPSALTVGEALIIEPVTKEITNTTVTTDTLKLEPPAPGEEPPLSELDVKSGQEQFPDEPLILTTPEAQDAQPENTGENQSSFEVSPLSPTGWTTIKSEGFEGQFPNGAWQVFDNDGSTNGQYYWDDDDYKPRAGSWSAWAANGGANARDPQYSFYANNMRSWMRYGPFDLSNANDAELLFHYWNQSEANYDYFGWYASANGTNFYGYRVSGDSGGWRYVNFDLTAVPTLGNLVGDSSVWIAFIFNSDSSIVDDGPFVDDVLLQKNTISSCPNQYFAEYYNNRYLSGSPTFTRCENWPISQNWGSGGPGGGVSNDNFSVRWTGRAHIAAGTYTFKAVADDGVKVWLDNVLIIDGWRDQPPTEYRTTRTLAAGEHSIKMEYYENGGGAIAQFRWDPAPTCPTITQWRGEYWNNQSLSGTPVLCRNDVNLDFDWSSSSPASVVPSDHFSARWTRSIYYNAGRYRFHLKGDDGIRLWVDGNLIINQWRDQGFTEYTADIDLTAGNHNIKVEYYENGGAAAVKLWWEVTTDPVQFFERDGFYVFKIDMLNSNVSIEMVMANDNTNVNQTPTPVESVSAMVARQPYASRNPILAFNADYFAPNLTHGPEGLTVKNGVRFDGSGASPDDEDGNEWKRSSLSISQSKVLRVGKQTNCTNSCVHWTPDANAFYNTVGGGPLFIEGGQRIGGSNSPLPCQNENFSYTNQLYYCQQSYNWTGVGVSQDGRYMIVIISGTPKTMDSAAQVLINMGAWRAIKLDGGGSTHLWYRPRGELVRGSRLIANALVVFAR